MEVAQYWIEKGRQYNLAYQFKVTVEDLPSIIKALYFGVTPQGHQSSSESLTLSSITYITVACVSFLLLCLSLLGFLLWRRRRGFGLNGKLELANVIALEDLQDPERNCELLSSLRRGRGSHQLPSSSSEQDVSDGVFLMVYLPSPYEQTLTRIARAASMSSSKDGDVPPSPGPETGSREEEDATRVRDEKEIMD